MLSWAVNKCDGPVAIRYPRGGDGQYHGARWDSAKPAVIHRDGNACAIITYGTMINQVNAAAESLAQQGIEAKVIRLTALNPLSCDVLIKELTGISNAFVVEEISSNSGICAALSHELSAKTGCKFTGFDLGSAYVTHGSILKLYKKHGLDAASIANKIQEVLNCEN